MNYTSINSPSNKYAKFILSLHDADSRRKNNKFIIEGLNLVNEALLLDINFDFVAVNIDFIENPKFLKLLAKITDKSKVIYFDNKIFSKLVTTSSQCNVLAVIDKFKYNLTDIPNRGSIIVLDNIQDPANMGSIFRIASAYDVSGIIMTKGCVDVYNPKVVRATAAQLFKIPHVYLNNNYEIISFIKSSNRIITTLDSNSKLSIYKSKITLDRAIVIGNEGHGVSADLADSSREILKIPTNSQLDSLNVSISLAIALNYWWSKCNGFDKA